MSGNNKNKKSPAKLYAAASVIFAVFFLIAQVSCCPFSVFSPGAVKDNEVFESEISLHPGELEIESETGTETAILLQPELTLISRLQIPGQAIDVKTYGGFSYLTNDLGTLFVIDVRDKKSPGIIGSVSEINSANIVIVEGDYAYVSYTEWIKSSQTSDNNDKEQSPQALEAYSICGFKIVDIKDKKNPSVVGDYISGTGQKKFVQGMAIEGNFAYINTTSILDGQTRSSLEIINISDKSDPVFTGSCDIEGQPNGLFVRGNYAYLNNTYFDYYNQRYLEKSNFFVVDISDKENPEIKSSCEVPANSWSVFVNDNYAYLTSSIIEEDTGDYTESLLQIIDVKNPEIPELKGQFSLYGGAWEMDVKDDFLLVSNRAGGISAVNISDAGSPFTAAIFKTGGSSYDVAVSGNYAYIADGFNGFLIISLQKNTPDGTIIEQSVVEDSAPVSIIDIYGDSFGNNILLPAIQFIFRLLTHMIRTGKS